MGTSTSRFHTKHEMQGSYQSRQVTYSCTYVVFQENHSNKKLKSDSCCVAH